MYLSSVDKCENNISTNARVSIVVCSVGESVPLKKNLHHSLVEEYISGAQ
jgi:hypothetical protein